MQQNAAPSAAANGVAPYGPPRPSTYSPTHFGQPAPTDRGLANQFSNINVSAGIAANTSAPTPSSLKDMKLYNDTKEREKYEQIADLYSIIKTVELLEKAYVRDSIPASEYAPACSKLIAQFKTLRNILKDSVPDVDKFMMEYRMDCPAAVNRLLKVGVPATVEHGGVSHDSTAKPVAEATQYFITAMDSLRLNMTAVDQIFPLLSELLEGLNKIGSLSPDFEGKVKVKNWVQKLHQMRASEELDTDQIRQLQFDLETSYNAFHKALSR